MDIAAILALARSRGQEFRDELKMKLVIFLLKARSHYKKWRKYYLSLNPTTRLWILLFLLGGVYRILRGFYYWAPAAARLCPQPVPALVEAPRNEPTP
eukprot:g33420.t1